ncbi:MAG: PASTA domain-containing protein [Bacteroidota bacterium]
MFRYFISREFFLTLLGLIVAGVLVYLMIFFWILPAYTRHGDSIVVPSVVEMSWDEAEKELSKMNLKPMLTDSAYNPDLEPGSVLAQYPRQHSFVKPNRTISLTINQRKPPQVPVPAIIDKTLYQAKAQLESWKLAVGKVTRKKDIAENTILDILYDGRRVKAGTMVPQGAKIDLIVSDGQGSVSVRVPDLTGLNFEEALNSIRELGLTLGALSYNSNGPANKSGIVYGQNPKPTRSDSVTVGYPIDLYIYGRAPETNEGI